MFNLFKKKSEGKEPDENDGLEYNASTVKVSYDGEVISSEYAERSLVIVHNKLREEFNDQDYLFHMLLPHGKGKIKYTDPRLAEENKDLSIEDAIQIIADNKSMNQVEIVDEGNSQE